jgi:hypothetical protein
MLHGTEPITRYDLAMRNRSLVALLVAVLCFIVRSLLSVGGSAMSNIHFRKGSSSAETLFTLSSSRFYEGPSTTKTLLTISGDRVYEGPGTAKTLMNWDGGLSEIEFAAAVWL